MTGIARIRAWLTLACAAVAASVLSSCAMYEARCDQREVSELANVTGAIAVATGPETPIVVGLFRDESGRKALAAYFVRYGPGPFRFVVPAGSYQLFAFEDSNGNLKFDAGEAIHYEGEDRKSTRLNSSH